MPTAELHAYDQNTPRQPSFGNAGTVGMILFLAALFMLFAASLLAYVMVRLNGANAPPAGSIHLPGLLWLSTAMVIGVSVALTVATRQIRVGKHRSYRKSLTAALALAAGFLTVQAPAMVSIFKQHAALRSSNVAVYGLIFFLILVHALHVVGGMVVLVTVTIKAHRGAYERPVVNPTAAAAAGAEAAAVGPLDHDPIRHTTLYWHFLDCVWIVMFMVLLVLR
jgi:heme/copper-type cytochrome/quinol oxidase subunit 3